MGDFQKDPELERMLKNVQPKSMPDSVMDNYKEGVRLKIAARKEFLGFYVPLLAITASVALLWIVFLVLCHYFEPKETAAPIVRQIPAKSVVLNKVTVPAKTTAASEAAPASLAAINQKLAILQALDEDPTEEIINAMNVDQLAEEISYWDRFNIASPAHKSILQTSLKA
jgi:hypothetical protein